MLELYIGNKRFSSWSMRPWLVVKSTGIPFTEHLIPLDQPNTASEISAVNPAGRVPALRDGDLTVWDSLAICEYLNEKFPEAGLWPKNREARAVARSACAEMHSSFSALRSELTMRIYPPTRPVPACVPSEAARREIDRITSLWADLRRRFGGEGPYLFGEFSIADAFYAPVAIGRFRAYAVPLPKLADDYVSTLAAHPAVMAWVADAHAETLRAPKHE